ncbi:neuroplastin-like [Bradysia coprophila]|uniref:neuroplastin-like n=1 Tax=Bradysia coprophila TaxID=38358 RepID=UPI00187D7E3B|nr:neuroplastin-like [Bradysia coprophila]
MINCNVQIIVSILLLNILAIQGQRLIPNYDNVDYKLKVFDDRYSDPLILSCNITTPGNYTLEWRRNGTLISEIPHFQNRHQIIDAEYKLIIAPTLEEDAGLFTCGVPALLESHEFNVVANVYFRFNPPNVYLIEGNRLQIYCLAYGTDPEIIWTVGNQTYNESAGNIILQEDWRGVKNSILVIESVAYADRQVYNCTATNMAVKYGNSGYEIAVETTLVRIREKMAPLWPVCGIAVEVVVLFLIFFIYEKTKTEEESEERAYAREFVESRQKKK